MSERVFYLPTGDRQRITVYVGDPAGDGLIDVADEDCVCLDWAGAAWLRDVLIDVADEDCVCLDWAGAAWLRDVLIGLDLGTAPQGEPPVERTPEMVLRAMLRAYEAAALEAMRAYYQAEDDYDSPEWGRFNHLDDCVDELRAETAYLIAGYPGPELTYPILATDYEARLRGERPLNAPPPEGP